MNCDKVQYILIELTPGETLSNQVLNHIENCKSCKSLYKAGHTLEQLTEAAGKFNDPELDYDRIADNVMRSIESSRKAKPGNGILEWFEKGLIQPAVRLVLTSLIIFIIGSFLFEEFAGIEKIRLMENRFSGISSSAEFRTKHANAFSKLEELINSSLNRLSLAPGNTNVLDGDNLLEMFGILLNREVNKNQPLEILLKNKGIDIEDGLSIKELKTILSEKEKVKDILLNNSLNGGK